MIHQRLGIMAWYGTLIAVAGCSVLTGTVSPITRPVLTPASETSRDLINLPMPKGKIIVAVYGFRDQTGQYKPAPDSSFSTAVTQGATSMMLKAMRDSGWFIPVERENLQNLLTERRIVRALDGQQPPQPPENIPQLPPLMFASILLEGGIVSYESNVRTGGAGAKYFGQGFSTQYQTDQVTVSLRAVDIRTGRILESVSTTKTVYSFQVDAGVFQYIAFKRLLEAEVGMTRNEPRQLCVRDAIEAALVHMIVQGVMDNNWALKDPEDVNSPVFQAYLKEQQSWPTGQAVQTNHTVTRP